MFKTVVIAIIILACTNASFAQNEKSLPKGNLFIMGGGDRNKNLMQQLMKTAAMGSKDYIVVLPMSSEEPDTSFFYIKQDFDSVSNSPIVSFNFTANKVNNTRWLDSLQHAKLIFITGGDQSRFMKAVLNTPVFKIIHDAYNNGATIAGTSAGAAVMSKLMITGNQLRGDTEYHPTFDRLWKSNIEFQEGLGLLDSVIVDQHFIVRSRYNRLLSALAEYPAYTCIGVDEATAIIVHQNKITVAGESEVIVLKHPQQLSIDKGLIKFKDVEMSIYTGGDNFELK